MNLEYKDGLLKLYMLLKLSITINLKELELHYLDT